MISTIEANYNNRHIGYYLSYKAETFNTPAYNLIRHSLKDPLGSFNKCIDMLSDNFERVAQTKHTLEILNFTITFKNGTEVIKKSEESRSKYKEELSGIMEKVKANISAT